MKRPTRNFFRRDAVAVARDLLGMRVVRVVAGERLAGLIVETEAYTGPEDQASHAFGGRRTARTETMFADGGTVYVYLNYGLHHLLNIVTGPREHPAAVLIRALEPVEGVDAMFARRPTARRTVDLCSGPGKLSAALAIDRRENNADLLQSDLLFLEVAPQSAANRPAIRSAARIGVDYAGVWAKKRLRFFIPGNPHVSRSR